MRRLPIGDIEYSDDTKGHRAQCAWGQPGHCCQLQGSARDPGHNPQIIKGIEHLERIESIVQGDQLNMAVFSAKTFQKNIANCDTVLVIRDLVNDLP